MRTNSSKCLPVHLVILLFLDCFAKGTFGIINLSVNIATFHVYLKPSWKEGNLTKGMCHVMVPKTSFKVPHNTRKATFSLTFARTV